ncbi:hypothetical protein FOVSG1_008104 [Fusarium oxysporum f. sp. vasinfectum]
MVLMKQPQSSIFQACFAQLAKLSALHFPLLPLGHHHVVVPSSHHVWQLGDPPLGNTDNCININHPRV